ncbi:type VI secretion system-associated lipoprotein [Mangrovibacter phragmitis]|uniref:Type VI secretion system-associated lipoprotein n=3 Tax=Enterobacteriaceae TaxID=543 RepID=A0A1B7L3P3_9ENTR|nr:type VI secretion system-associated lipoprotein [Mangrovibacter phragmitis]PWW03056.1 type VI secretion system protein VasD [Mangrovibacter plantisponsor]
MMKTRLMRQGLLAFFMVALALLSGCVSSSRTVPAKYNLVFMAHPQINQSAPLKIRVFLLKSDADFMSADFYSLQNNPQGVLGANLLNSDQFFLMPGQQNKQLTGQSTPDARFIGIMAEYQSLDGKKWRVSLPLPAPSEDSFYKFWKWSSDTLEAHLFLDINGIRVVNE